MKLQTIKLKETYDYLAPDGSEIRLLLDTRRGGLAHCVLPSGKVSQAVKHKTVEEIWYILEGEGKMWRREEGREDETVDLSKGICVNIPVGVSFQFRNTSDKPLEILISTMPKWPGANEAIGVEGCWK